MPRPPKIKTGPTYLEQRRAVYLASLRVSAELLRTPLSARELADARAAAGHDAATVQSAHEHIQALQALGCRFEVESTFATASFGPPAKRYRLTHEPPGVLPPKVIEPPKAGPTLQLGRRF